MTVLTTERLDLRHLTEDDAAFMLKLVNSPGWLQYIGDRNVHTEAEAAYYLRNTAIKSYGVNGFGLYMMRTMTGDQVGICGLIRRPGLEDADIGFALLPQYAGKGYASEAAKAIMQTEARALGLKRVVAITSKTNNASVNVLTKAGFTFERTVILPGDTEELLLFGCLL